MDDRAFHFRDIKGQKTVEGGPLVSVITMVLNGVKYLEPCIESILSQSYAYIEHVVVDGDSSDGTVEMLASYATRYPHRITFISEPDRGSGDAWNKGLRIAKGEILGWVGADDTYEPDAVENVVNFFKSNPEADFVYGSLNYIDNKGEITRTYQAKDTSPEELVNDYCAVPTLAAFYKRKVIETVGGFDDLGNDLDFFIRVAKAFRMHRIDRVLSNYRIHEGSQNTGSNVDIRIMWKREDCLVSRRHGGRFFSGYCKRYYRLLLTERLRPILGPTYRLVKRSIRKMRLIRNH